MQEKLEALQKEFNDKFEALKNEYLQQHASKLNNSQWVKYVSPLSWFDHPTKVFRVKEIIVNRNRSFLRPHADVWNIDGQANADVQSFEEATDADITAHLKAEALERGYKKGSVVEHIAGGWNSIIEGDTFQPYHNARDDDSFYMCRTLIYKKGQWAKILEKEERIMIGGYEVKFIFARPIPPMTSIDGHKFSKEFWEAAKLISEHSKAKIMVGCSKQFDVSLDTINQILKRLNRAPSY